MNGARAGAPAHGTRAMAGTVTAQDPPAVAAAAGLPADPDRRAGDEPVTTPHSPRRSPRTTSKGEAGAPQGAVSPALPQAAREAPEREAKSHTVE